MSLLLVPENHLDFPGLFFVSAMPSWFNEKPILNVGSVYCYYTIDVAGTFFYGGKKP